MAWNFKLQRLEEELPRALWWFIWMAAISSQTRLPDWQWRLALTLAFTHPRIEVDYWTIICTVPRVACMLLPNDELRVLVMCVVFLGTNAVEKRCVVTCSSFGMSLLYTLSLAFVIGVYLPVAWEMVPYGWWWSIGSVLLYIPTCLLFIHWCSVEEESVYLTKRTMQIAVGVAVRTIIFSYVDMPRALIVMVLYALFQMAYQRDSMALVETACVMGQIKGIFAVAKIPVAVMLYAVQLVLVGKEESQKISKKRELLCYLQALALSALFAGIRK